MRETVELVTGRALDALVAEKVMGLHREDIAAGSLRTPYGTPFPTCDAALFFTPEGLQEYQTDFRFENNMFLLDIEHPERGHWDILPHYSTDIAAAWQIVDHLRSGERGFNLFAANSASFPAWIATFYPDAYEDHEAAADTAPMAICLAALAALEHD